MMEVTEMKQFPKLVAFLLLFALATVPLLASSPCREMESGTAKSVHNCDTKVMSAVSSYRETDTQFASHCGLSVHSGLVGLIQESRQQPLEFSMLLSHPAPFESLFMPPGAQPGIPPDPLLIPPSLFALCTLRI